MARAAGSRVGTGPAERLRFSLGTQTALRGVGSGTGGAGSRAFELYYEHARGRDVGSLHDALNQVSLAAGQNLATGIADVHAERLGDASGLSARMQRLRFRRPADAPDLADPAPAPPPRRRARPAHRTRPPPPAGGRGRRRPPRRRGRDPAPRRRRGRPRPTPPATAPAPRPSTPPPAPATRASTPPTCPARPRRRPRRGAPRPAQRRGRPPPPAAAPRPRTTGDDVQPMPEGTVMMDPDPRDAAGSLEMYRTSIRDDPGREAAIYRNPVTGEHIVVQGERALVSVEGTPPAPRAPPPPAPPSAGRSSSPPTPAAGSSSPTTSPRPPTRRAASAPTACPPAPTATSAR
jgi:hypothetical protein